jgi:NAD(P)H-flavin reductase
MALKTTAAATGLAQAPHPMLPRPFRVVRYRRELRDTFTLFLEPEDGTKEFHFEPGQFNMLYHPGTGEVPISISGDPQKPGQLVHTIRAVGNVTRLLQQYRPGDILGVRGPFGSPWPVAAAAGLDVLIVAGGLGLAPLRPVIYQVLNKRHLYGNVEVIYGARSPREMLYRQELERWRGRFDLRVHATVDSSGSDWRGNVGVVTNLISHARFDPLQTAALVCGPGVMMRFTIQELTRLGLQPKDIFVSLERNMQCGLGLCGHCQLGPFFVCKDGPVYSYDRVGQWFEKREI